MVFFFFTVIIICDKSGNIILQNKIITLIICKGCMSIIKQRNIEFLHVAKVYFDLFITTVLLL